MLNIFPRLVPKGKVVQGVMVEVVNYSEHLSMTGPEGKIFKIQYMAGIQMGKSVFNFTTGPKGKRCAAGYGSVP